MTLTQDGKLDDKMKVPDKTIKQAEDKLSLRCHGDSKWLGVLVEGDQNTRHSSTQDTTFEQT